MERLSSNMTLFFKFFVPVFWIVFFGAFTIATFVYQHEFYGKIPGQALRIGALAFFLSGLVMFYFTLMQLKRVEGDASHLMVTDYFKTYRYPLDSIAKITESKFLFLRLSTIHLKEKGSFGVKMPFISSSSQYEEYMQKFGGELRK